MQDKMTRLERLSVLFNYLECFEYGYENGDFSSVLPHLSRNCVFESMWVLTPMKGYEEVADYLTKKGETMIKADSLPLCYIAELVGDIKYQKCENLYLNGKRTSGLFGLRYQPGELCLVMEQCINDEENTVILRLTLDEKCKIARIDLCDHKLFEYRDYCPYVTLLPRSGEEEIKAGLIRIGEGYISELYLFLRMVDECFDEYYNISIPMNKWREALEKWKLFYSFESFDDALEYATGIDYESFTVKDKKALDILSRDAHSIWENRRTNPWIISALIEWTEKYKLCDSISSYGF